MPERIIYHNPDHVNHKGWIDVEGKPWDVPERLFPVIDALLSDDTGRTEWMVMPEFHPETLDLLAKVHSTEMIEAIARASEEATDEHPVKTRFDKDGDTDSSAIYPGTFEQAVMSAECAVSGADALLSGQTDLAITVSRPPGHHAGREFYHGFCYFNLAAAAAEAMKESGKRVAILDFDIHHGDGTQDIFYDDPNVMYASLHADPTLVMPGTGHAHEIGNHGTMVNFPLPIGVDRDSYMLSLTAANKRIEAFAPDFLTISAWIAYYSFRHRAITITKSDWVSLIVALGAIPLWLITKQPLLSVIIISIIDLVAFWITIRKTYHLPYSENLAQNIMSTAKHILTMGAQQQFSWITLLYPASLAITTVGFTIMILIRRRQVAPPKHESTELLPG